jgi:hypothetical protein
MPHIRRVLVRKEFSRPDIARPFFVVIAATLLSAGCATTVYFKPTASGGEAVQESNSCPGPMNVLQFSPPDIPWVHVRLSVNVPNHAWPTSLHIEIQTQPGLGLPRSEWRDNKSDEFLRRSNHSYEIRAESPRVVLTYSDGKQSVFISRLLTDTQPLQSRTIALANERIKLSDTPIDGFSIQLPPIFIDGSKIDFPLITFKLAKGTYEWVLNC